MPENMPDSVGGSFNNTMGAERMPVAGGSSEMGRKRLLTIVIVLSVLSTVGIGGTAWGLAQTRARDERIDNLTAKLVENNISVDEEEDVETGQSSSSGGSSQGVSEKPVEGGMSTAVVPGSGQGPYIKDGYFYVPEWEVKYRLSEELTDYGYAVAQDSLSNSFGKYEIGMTAVDKGDLLSNPQARYYDDIFSCSAVRVTRTDRDLSNLFGPKKIVNAGGVQYVIYDYKSIDGCNFEDKASKVVDRLVEIFSNPERI